jgi:hypothetical protein
VSHQLRAHRWRQPPHNRPRLGPEWVTKRILPPKKAHEEGHAMGSRYERVCCRGRQVTPRCRTQNEDHSSHRARLSVQCANAASSRIGLRKSTTSNGCVAFTCMTRASSGRLPCASAQPAARWCSRKAFLRRKCKERWVLAHTGTMTLARHVQSTRSATHCAQCKMSRTGNVTATMACVRRDSSYRKGSVMCGVSLQSCSHDSSRENVMRNETTRPRY